jgi:uncharacterized phage protein gp47/JayE
MTITIPTTAEIAQQHLTKYESVLNQTTPPNDKAYNRTVAGVEAASVTSLYKLAIERALQNLVQTATGKDLENWATQYGITLKPATNAVLTATTGSTSTIPATKDYVADGTAIRYSIPADTIPVASVATLTLTAKTAGVIGNLSINDTLSIGDPNPGTDTTATVTAVVSEGTDAETDEELRVRVLDKIRAPGGGGNAADYRNWSQETPGVVRTYPYSSNVIGVTAVPPDRIVYVQVNTDLDADGIPTQSKLDEVRSYITLDPDTGRTRQPLGLTDATLYVEPIIRTGFYVEVRGLTVDASLEAQVKANIETAVSTYFRGLAPYVDGLDPVDEAVKAKITDSTITIIVQDVVASAGGIISGLGFGIAPGLFVGSYFLSQGETAKLAAGGISYL